jgi:hypothetical protein
MGQESRALVVKISVCLESVWSIEYSFSITTQPGTAIVQFDFDVHPACIDSQQAISTVKQHDNNNKKRGKWRKTTSTQLILFSPSGECLELSN